MTFCTHSIQVAHTITGAVYLSGALERGIAPEDCLWTQSGGAAEDGCLLVLKKMNLELLQRCHYLLQHGVLLEELMELQHSNRGWPSLFAGITALSSGSSQCVRHHLPRLAAAQTLRLLCMQALDAQRDVVASPFQGSCAHSLG